MNPSQTTDRQTDRQTTDRQTTDRQTFLSWPPSIWEILILIFFFFFAYGRKRTNGVKFIPPCFARRGINESFYNSCMRSKQTFTKNFIPDTTFADSTNIAIKIILTLNDYFKMFLEDVFHSLFRNGKCYFFIFFPEFFFFSSLTKLGTLQSQVDPLIAKNVSSHFSESHFVKIN